MRDTTRPVSVAALVAGAVIAGSLMGGCLPPEEKPATLPPLTGSASPEASSSGAPSSTSTADDATPEETAARDVYIDWATHYLQGQYMSNERRREFLTQWLVEPALSEYVDITEKQLDQHMRIHGTRVPHVFSVEPSGSGVKLEDCADMRPQVLKDTRTGNKIDTETVDFLWVTAWLTETDDGWRIRKIDATTKPCRDRIPSTATPGSPGAS